MKDAKKTVMGIAGVLIAVGLILALVAFAGMKFDFRRLDTTRTEEQSYTIKESFRSIHIEGAECDIRLLPSEDKLCRVECIESSRIFHKVAVEGDTLTIERVDRRRWYEHFGFQWGRTEVKVFLPQREYEALYAKTLSGDMEVPEGFTFTRAEANTASGEVSFSAVVKGELTVKTVSGDIYAGHTAPERLSLQSTSGEVTVDTIKQETELSVQTTSGDIELRNITCRNISAESTSGEIRLSRLYASEKIRIESVSGDVELRDCDGDSLSIRNTSGEVSGRLATEKIFITDTVSGRVDVPRSVSGGICEVKTTSGNIEFTIG